MTNSAAGQVAPGDEALLAQYQALQAQFAAERLRQQALWPLLVEASRRLQVSSASIKAAVSSLLDHDIFWDISNQQEFLDTINRSVDQEGRLALLLSLALQLETGGLELRRELNSLPEIISTVLFRLPGQFPWVELAGPLPPDTRPVMADFGYFTLALELLLESLGPPANQAVSLRVTDTTAGWQVELNGPSGALAALQAGLSAQPYQVLTTAGLPSDHRLRQYVSARLLALHEVQSVPGRDDLRLVVPAAAVAAQGRGLD